MRIFVAVYIVDFLHGVAHFSVAPQIVKKHKARIKIDAFQNIICNSRPHKRIQILIFLKIVVQTADKTVARKNNATKDRGFGTGYYYYDSDHNGADYNKKKNRFYVYKDKQYIQNEDKDGNGWKPNNDRTTGFMPFSPIQNGDVMEKSGQTNYWFGMKTEVDFFLPDDVGKQGGNYTSQNKPMRFYEKCFYHQQ